MSDEIIHKPHQSQLPAPPINTSDPNNTAGEIDNHRAVVPKISWEGYTMNNLSLTRKMSDEIIHKPISLGKLLVYAVSLTSIR